MVGHRHLQKLTKGGLRSGDRQLAAIGVINVSSIDSGQQCRFGERILAGLPAGLSFTIGMVQTREDNSSLGRSYLEAYAALDYRLGLLPYLIQHLNG